MLKIKVNGAPASLFARLRPDEGWDLRCLDPLVGEFRIRCGDTLHLWSEEFGYWLPATECDLTELAVRETEKQTKNMSHGTSCCFLDDLGRQCGKPANFGISWHDDSGKENAVWYCLPHIKEMLAADDMQDLLSAHVVNMPFEEYE
jgi:hypothetical protein